MIIILIFAAYYRQLSADAMHDFSIWLTRTGSNPADINRFQSYIGKFIPIFLASFCFQRSVEYFDVKTDGPSDNAASLRKMSCTCGQGSKEIRQWPIN